VTEPVQVHSEFGEVEVLDVDEKPHRLGEVWERRPCVLIFVRHFG